MMQFGFLPLTTMKSLIVLSLVTLCVSDENIISHQKAHQHSEANCIHDRHAAEAFRVAHDSFIVKLYKTAAPRGQNFFAISPYSVWITIAAIAEGADHDTQQKLFQLLSLPADDCTRQKMYKAAEISEQHISIALKRALVIDESLTINPYWYDLVSQNSLVHVISAPIKRDPAVTTRLVNQILQSRVHYLNLRGNSVLLNSVTFNAVWSTAFSGATIERAPFYSRGGRRIGSVDLMRMRKRVRIGYVPGINCKVIEIPLDADYKYSIMLGFVADSDPDLGPVITNATASVMKEIVDSFQDTGIPIDIAIPRLEIQTEIDMRDLLEDMGVVNLWNSGWATRYISTPPAYPTSYIQRITVTFNNRGSSPPSFEYPSYPHQHGQNQYWREFIADRPFMFSVCETKTYTILVSGMVSRPTYYD